MNQAYYAADLAQFLRALPETILGHLADNHPHDLNTLQRNAWRAQIALLQRELRSAGDGWIALEFSIPRMGKRADAIVIREGIIFVLEFKMGTEHYDRSAIDQVTDYALDLKNFHADSHTRRLVPILVATEASTGRSDLKWSSDGVAEPLLSNAASFGALIRMVLDQTPKQEGLAPQKMGHQRL